MYDIKMENINQMPSGFKESFLLTDIGKQIENDYDLIIDNEVSQAFSSPREDCMTSCFSIAPFYYTNLLTEKNTGTIYDIGCGSNLLKKYYPEIIGIDPENDKADLCDTFNYNFITKYENAIQSLISINAIHFIPITQINERLYQINLVLSDKGRAFVTFNLARMMERTEHLDFLGIFDFKKFSPDTKYLQIIESYIRAELYNSKLNFVCIDIDFSVYNAFLNGNIRLVFDKTQK